jgi:hypothetical protein
MPVLVLFTALYFSTCMAALVDLVCCPISRCRFQLLRCLYSTLLQRALQRHNNGLLSARFDSFLLPN